MHGAVENKELLFCNQKEVLFLIHGDVTKEVLFLMYGAVETRTYYFVTKEVLSNKTVKEPLLSNHGVFKTESALFSNYGGIENRSNCFEYGSFCFKSMELFQIRSY